MRICLFTPNFLPTVGGAERMADLLCRSLIARGHDVQVLCQKQKAGPPIAPYPVHLYHRPPAMHLWPGSIGRSLGRLHRRWPFDVVLAFYAYPTGYAASRLKSALNFGLVISTRGGDLYPTSHLHQKPGVMRAIRAGYKNADQIISLSGWMTQRLHEVVGPPLPPIHTIPNGIDLTEHDRLLADAADHRPQFIDSARPFALQLATLTPVKRHDLVLDALAQSRSAFDRARAQLIIAGDGQCRAALQEQIAARGLGDIVKLVGTVSGRDKYWLLAHARFMLSASIAEGLPNALIEAMASGLPVLASDISPHEELLAGAKWGCTFATDDAAALAASMTAMWSMDLSSMKAAALGLRREYDLVKMIDRYEQICLAVRR